MTQTLRSAGHRKAVQRSWAAVGIAGGLLLLMACGEVPDTRYFRVEYPLPAPAANTPLPLTLGIAQLTAPEPYREERIIYQTSPYQVQFYPHDRWESPPVDMVNDRLLELFAASGEFQRVTRWRRGEAPVYRLEPRLRRFEEVDEQDAWYGVVELEYELLDPDGRSLLRQVVSRRVRAGARNPEGTVEALSRALRAVLDEVLMKTVASLRDAQP